MEEALQQLERLAETASSAATIGATAVLVNLFNDLPAATLLLERLPEKTLLLQAMLSTMNIVCYVTPTGSLAGIIWFHLLKQERKSEHPAGRNSPSTEQRHS